MSEFIIAIQVLINVVVIIWLCVNTNKRNHNSGMLKKIYNSVRGGSTLTDFKSIDVFANGLSRRISSLERKLDNHKKLTDGKIESTKDLKTKLANQNKDLLRIVRSLAEEHGKKILLERPTYRLRYIMEDIEEEDEDN